MPKVARSVPEKYWAKVARSEGGGCWAWTGRKNRNGYGQIATGKKGSVKTLMAHRVSWELHFGPIPGGLWCLHKCDNPQCTNPSHLFLGDRVANMLDCAEKGRVTKIGKSRLTHCKRGHEFTQENTIKTKAGHRRCLECTTNQAAAYREKATEKMRERRAKARLLNNACAAPLQSGKANQ